MVEKSRSIDLEDDLQQLINAKIETAENLNRSFYPSAADALRRGVGTPMAQVRKNQNKIKKLKKKYQK
ncbi:MULTISPECIES: hypothetical protein [Pectobacteriaceae]|uniref:hypothetical protein n=1 Tax=Pectobacteriaceae TaxID=1903410 RepID=UPI000580A628|nr:MULTISPECIES: hypothetical protein [Pectobacteriaceae]AUQ25094.1 hypothetical protein C1O30_08450 [Dickeya zeae]KHT36884.1 hypothetical protein RC99_05075 [Pectobacterium carotovorum subsp. carotovorum]MCQ8231502.1 hypothetical protein [Pectobacterium carotovorum]RJL48940.1 hypothetical protein D5078_02020 [Pectobacterium carotovorum]UJR58177.1 hypothetical protein HJ580_08355 [Dickeya zeae]